MILFLIVDKISVEKNFNISLLIVEKFSQH